MAYDQTDDSRSTLEDLLQAHVEAFNQGARTGDFEPMLRMYHPDAIFEITPPGMTSIGIEAIRRAYAEQPPDDTMTIRSREIDGPVVTVTYSWDTEPDKITGIQRLEFKDGRVVRNSVTL
jgi:ketosteroid isomerase-like protein